MLTPNVWTADYKLPWHDPGFSTRMLAEHLTQDHDLASRRTLWIDRQVAWLHGELLGGRPARILDLGCGPGFYATRLVARGHRCHGLDIGPAAIAYAQQHNPDPDRGVFTLADLRTAAFGGPYDLAMFLYGEMNVFAPTELRTMLKRIHAALTPTGRFIFELQTPESVESVGRGPTTEETSSGGLFSSGPHRWRTENVWLPDERVAVQTFTVTEQGSAPPRVYRSTTQAWPADALRELLTDAGFAPPIQQPTWPCNTDAMVLYMATRT